MTRLRLRVAERLKGAQNTYAMLTTFNEVDMTSLMQMRSQYKVMIADAQEHNGSTSHHSLHSQLYTQPAQHYPPCRATPTFV
jgi:pyruvate/2-oxoglutarate dehydrogenase complex dihydrolipoamide acyltransferase (E2) component